MKWHLILILICSSLMMLVIFSYTYWPFIYLLCKNVYSNILPDFKDYIFRAVLCSQQNWAESTEISHICPAPAKHTASPTINITLYREWYIYHSQWMYTNTPLSPKVHSFYIRFTFDVVHPVKSDACQTPML